MQDPQAVQTPPFRRTAEAAAQKAEEPRGVLKRTQPGARREWLAIPTLPQGHPCSTIGVLELNFRVRNGIGWILRTIFTNQRGANTKWRVDVVSSKTSYRATGRKAERTISTRQLNTLLCLHPAPINQVVFLGPSGRARLEGGFPLRCFQRLSRPHVATRQCRWRDNRNTRGASIPVLSY